MFKNNPAFKIGNRTVVISYITQFFQYGIALIVLPVILKQLEATEIGVWYLFLSISSLINLMDFGFGPSIQRSVAFVASGAQELKKDGLVITEDSQVNIKLMASLFQTSRKLYKKISLAILFLSMFCGTLYLYNSLKEDFTIYLFFIWSIFVLSTSINFYFSYILSFLKGYGFIEEYNKNIIISKVLYILVLYIMLIAGCGILSLVLATFVNCISMMVQAEYVLSKKVEYYKSIVRTKKYEDLIPILWKNAKNGGIVSIGVFMLSQAGVLLSGFYLDIREVGQLGLTLQILGIIVVLARVNLTTNIPRISSLWVFNDTISIRKLFIKCQIVGYLIFFLGVFILIIFGNSILENFLHSNVLLPSSSVLLLYSFFYFMEITHGNCCSLIATSNNIPFAYASIISGITSIICTLLFIFLNWGIISFPLGLICGSLPYNSWKWPLLTYRMLRK